MSYADEKFIELCQDILTNGTNTKGQKVRPHWEDGEQAYTLKKFGVINRYDLRKEFPAITLRRTAIRSAVDEILWIYQKKSNNINELHSHIWDEWADASGSIGKAYGYQVGQKLVHHTCRGGITVEHDEALKQYPSYETQYNRKDGFDVLLDQMDAVLYDLKHSPFGRRIMISLWNTSELHEMNLQPCCWSITFNVTDEGLDKLVLNMMLNQRSSDTLTANNWNVVQYAVLLMMVAQVSDMIPGELVHVITDAHIYDRHVPIVEELISQPTFSAPKVTLNPNIKNFYDFTRDDIIVEDYYYNKFEHTIPVAI